MKIINSLTLGRCICNLDLKLILRHLKHFLWNCFQFNATRPHWWLVSIGSGNGLVTQASSHCLNQCWPSSVMTQWVNLYGMLYMYLDWIAMGKSQNPFLWYTFFLNQCWPSSMMQQWVNLYGMLQFLHRIVMEIYVGGSQNPFLWCTFFLPIYIYI